MPPAYPQIAKLIDHSLLNPTLTENDLETGCQVARELDVASVCIMPFYLRRCATILAGSSVAPSTTIGFPHGVQTTSVKLAETARALDDGGRELDMVVNISRVKSHDYGLVRDEIGAVTELTHAHGARLKVIFETCYLTNDEKVKLAELCGELNVDWVKTSTGFGTAGATEADIELLRRHSPSHVQVKASGGIRELSSVLRFRELGATRCGTSRSAEILAQARLLNNGA